jgi:hypothetical protein
VGLVGGRGRSPPFLPATYYESNWVRRLSTQTHRKLIEYARNRDAEGEIEFHVRDGFYYSTLFRRPGGLRHV